MILAPSISSFQGEEYEAQAEEVDAIIARAASKIQEYMLQMVSECATGREYIEVTVEGYADPRALSKIARYPGEEIWDEQFEVFVPQETIMTNTLLSQLRAYFTALALQEALASSALYKQLKNRVRLSIRAGGILDEEIVPYEYLRKIEIQISMEGA